jgi:hypothetical protein
MGKGKPGEDLDYFRVVFDEAETESAARFAAAYPEEPRELNVILPFNRIDDVWDAWMEAYVASGLVHRSDGADVWFHINPLNGQKEVIEGQGMVQGATLKCPSANGEPVAQYIGGNGSKRNLFASPVGRLKVVIAELNRFAFLTVMTGSQHDIANISAQLKALEEIHGKIAWIPLKLRRRPKMVSTPMGDEGKRVRTEKWLLSVEADPDWVDAKIVAMEADVFPVAQSLDALPVDSLAMLPVPEDAEAEALEGAWREPDPTEPDPDVQQHPSEETVVSQVPPSAPVKLKERRSFTSNLMDAIVAEGITMDRGDAAKALGRSPWADKNVPLNVGDRPRVFAWLRLYFQFVEEGSMNRDQAAEAATVDLTEMS